MPDDDKLMEVHLYTREVGYVCTVETLRWKTMPEVIQWGSRVFIWDSVNKYYREGMIWPAILGVRFDGIENPPA